MVITRRICVIIKGFFKFFHFLDAHHSWRFLGKVTWTLFWWTPAKYPPFSSSTQASRDFGLIFISTATSSVKVYSLHQLEVVVSCSCCFFSLESGKTGCLIIRQNHDTMHYFFFFLKATRQHIVVMEIDFSPGKASVLVPIFSSILLNNFSSSPLATKVTAIPCVPVQSGR